MGTSQNECIQIAFLQGLQGGPYRLEGFLRTEIPLFH